MIWCGHHRRWLMPWNTRQSSAALHISTMKGFRTLLFSSLLLILSARVYTVYPQSPNIGKTVKHNIFIICFLFPVWDNVSPLHIPNKKRQTFRLYSTDSGLQSVTKQTIASFDFVIFSTNKFQGSNKLQFYLVIDLINLFWYLIHVKR